MSKKWESNLDILLYDHEEREEFGEGMELLILLLSSPFICMLIFVPVMIILYLVLSLIGFIFQW